MMFTDDQLLATSRTENSEWLTVEVTNHAQATRARVTGELDVATRDRLLARLAGLPVAGRRHLILDLADLQFIDLAGLTALAAVGRRVRATGGELTVVGLRALSRRVLALAGLDGAFDLR